MPLTQATPYGFGLFVAGLSLIPAIIATIALRPVPLQDEPVRSADRGGAAATVAGSIVGVLALIALVRTLQVSGLAATSNFFNLYLDSVLAVPTAQIGVLMALGRLVAVPAALSTAALTNRYGNKGVVIGASLATAASMLPIALIPHWGAASLSFMAVISLSWIRYAASIVFFLNLVPPRSRAVVSGVTEMAAGICFTALTFGGGYIIAYLGYETLFLLGAGLTALSALLFWLLFRGREPVVE
jgi:predicted MFS family arabinose efflux permease